MEENTLKKKKPELRDISKSRESIFEPTSIAFTNDSASRSSSGMTLPKRCKQLARRFIKSFSHPSSSKNDEKVKKSTTSKTDSMKKYPNDTVKDRTSKKRSAGSKNEAHTGIFSLQRKNDRTTQAETHYPEDRYFYVEGYGLVSETQLSDFLNMTYYDNTSDFSNSKSKSELNLNKNEDTVKKTMKNNLNQASELKKELNRSSLEKPIPKPRTKIKRSKSVAFMDEINWNAAENNARTCPTCSHCYESIDRDTNTKDRCEKTLIKMDYYEKTKSLPRTLNERSEELRRANSGFVNLDISRRNKIIDPDGVNKLRQSIRHKGSLDHIIDISKLSIETNFNDSSSDINSFAKKTNAERIYSNEMDKHQVTVKEIRTNDKNGRDKTETIVYRNPFYHLPSFVDSNAKNYDIKMYESKLTMDFLVDTEDPNKNPPQLNRSRSLRVNMDRAETIICENHYYGLTG